MSENPNISILIILGTFLFYHQFLFPDLNEKFAELSVGWMKLKSSRGVTYMLGQVRSSQVRAPRCVWVLSGPESVVVEERSQGLYQSVYTTMVK